MRHKKLVLHLFPLSSLLLMSCSIETQKMKYPPGKDTIHSFSDGTFSVGRFPSDVKLLNSEKQEAVDSYISMYRDIPPFAYVIGLKYTVLNYQSGEIRQFQNLDDIPNDLKKVFVEKSLFEVIQKK